MNKHTSPRRQPNTPVSEDAAEPERDGRVRSGRTGFLKGGKSRTLWVDSGLWESVPLPRSPFVRGALEAYLQTNPQQLDSVQSDTRGRYGAYLTEEIWTAINKLPGDANAHIEAALRAELERGHG